MTDATMPTTWEFQRRNVVTRRSVLGLLGAGLLPPVGRARVAEAADADRGTLVTGNNDFGLDLYGQLRTTSGNLFYSPYSISCALAMTYAGARGATADEMAKTLRFSLPPDRLHPAFGALIREINAPARKRANELSTANALWSQRGYPFERDFQQIASGSYGASLEELDFQRATETARRTINGWVERQTQDKIKDLIREGVLTPDTILVLSNAVYFKGAWMNAFAQGATRPGDFARGAGDRVPGVPLMHRIGVDPYVEGDAFQALELPYQANELSMIVLLPRKVDGLAELERTLTVERIDNWLARMTPQEVFAVLPRFKVSAEFRLEQPLQALGVRLAFSRQADFSGMVKVPPRPFVDAVIHKAYVDVNEKGTEAAAATAIGMPATSMRSPTPVFRADHPFFFLIRDRGTGSILFAGRLVNPLAS